jgi:hypothetical protein
MGFIFAGPELGVFQDLALDGGREVNFLYTGCIQQRMPHQGMITPDHFISPAPFIAGWAVLPLYLHFAYGRSEMTLRSSNKIGLPE